MENVANKIKEATNDTPYQWAVGYSDIVDNDYEKSFNIADKKMYEEKIKMKAVRT